MSEKTFEVTGDGFTWKCLLCEYTDGRTYWDYDAAHYNADWHRMAEHPEEKWLK